NCRMLSRCLSRLSFSPLSPLSSLRTLNTYCIHPNEGLTAEQIEMQNTSRSFAMNEMRPHMVKWDAEESLPLDVLRKAGDLGFGALYCDVENGGSGGSRTDASVVFEQLAMGDSSLAAYISIHNMCAWMIDTYGSVELKAKHIPSLASFEQLASYCLTEPDSGSDAAALRTSAVKKGDYYVVNGSKAFISGAGQSSKYVVMMRHEGEPGPKGIFCLLVEDGMEGFSLGKKEKKLGWNCQPTRIINFEDCKVPISNQIGGDREGFNIAMAGINGGRLNIASCSLGAAQMSVDIAIDHLKVRKQFNQRLADMQWNQFKLAELATKISASRLMVRRAAQSMDENSPQKAAHCAMAKLFATENCFEVVSGAMQMLGGYGMLKDFPLQQFMRDCRVHQVIEGTNEIMRMVIARDLLTKPTALTDA
ncbi:acdh-9, partial [Pristionchus pacificus]